MRFAFKTSPQNTTWDEMLAVWRAGDDIELFESAWNFDHFYPIFSDSAGPCMEAWVTLTALAQATKRLRVGTLVTGIHYRHPAVLANMIASLDIVSGGRLEVGIGAGWNEEESMRTASPSVLPGNAVTGSREGLPGTCRAAHPRGHELCWAVIPVDRRPLQSQAGPTAPSAHLRRG